MFAVDPATADSIHHIFNEDGEVAAIVEFRRHYPLLASNEHARTCVHAIAGWQPVALPPPPTQRRAKKSCPGRVMQD